MAATENLNRLIERAKPKAALLTSFTFGLSYFEAAILPTLRRNGCGSVSVLIDEGQYQASLGGARSSFAGRSYRINSVRAPGGGIFHPKIGYLECEVGDVLIVSSGNLTFSGQGGNLECLDAVRSGDHPEVFEEVGRFFDDLAKILAGESSQAASVLAEYSKRAVAQSKRSRPKREGSQRTAWLIHTLSMPAADQLRTLVAAAGSDFRQLTVFSPFHAPDASPIRALASNLGIKKIAIGLDPKKRSLALDAKRFGRPKDVSFVVPDLGDDKRESHAKWFEIAMADGVFVMTGSVNATEQSFASTKNVEVSLARVLRKGVVKWRKTEPREIKYFPFPFYGRLDAVGVVDASLLADGQLVGVVQAKSITPGRVTVVLLHRGEPVYEAKDVELSKARRFRCRVDAKWVESDGSLQIRVRGKDFEALGWVNNELQLEASEAERQRMAAVNRILSDVYTDDDVYELFSLLLDFTNSPTIGVRSRAPITGSPQDSSEPTPFSILDWERSGHAHLHPGLLGQSAGRGFEALYEWLSATSKDETKARQTGEGGTPDRGSGKTPPEDEHRTILSDETGGGGEASSGESKAERNSRLVHKLLQAIPEKLAENPSHPGAAELLRVAGAFAVRNALHLRSSDSASTHNPQPCLNWLDTYSRIGLRKDAIQSLTPHIVAMGCLAIVLAQGAASVMQVAAQVKESFQRFCVATSDEPKLRELCRVGTQHRGFALVAKEIREQLENELPRVLAVETGEDAVLGLLRRLERGEFVAATDREREFFGADVAEALRVYARAAKKRYGVVQDLDNAGCPCCFVVLPTDTIKRLRRTHAAVCSGMSCKRALFWVQARAVPGGDS